MSVYPTPFTVGVSAYTEGADDAHGNPVVTYATAVDVAVYAVAPGTPGEDYEVGRNPATIPLMVYGPTASLGSVAARSRVIWQGDTFEVDGAPEVYDYGPFSFAPGTRLRLMRVEG